MWPLSGADIRQALDLVEPGLSDGEFFTGVAVGGAQPRRGDVLLALTVNGRDGHQDIRSFFHGGGRLAIVAPEWHVKYAAEFAGRCLPVLDLMGAFKAIAARLRSGFTFPVVAVAGANGKTTTKDMTRALLGSRVTATPGTENGHYGVPLTLLDRAHAVAAPPRALVVEIGIDEVGAMRHHAALCRADVAVLTSLDEEHLRGLLDIETAAREELQLFESPMRARRVLNAHDVRLGRYVEQQRPGDVTVVDSQDGVSCRGGCSAILKYSIGTFDGRGRELSFQYEGTRGSLHVPMPGRHHARLAALALGVGFALGWTWTELERGWRSFTPPSGRAQVSRLSRDLILVDDTFDASPGSMREAIALAEEPCWSDRPKGLVLGDMLDLGDATAAAHAALVPRLMRLKGAHIRLFGEAMAAVHADLAGRAHGFGSLAHTVGDPLSLLDGVFGSLEGALVIVHASRGMRLERVCAALRRTYARPRPLPLRPTFADDFLTVGVTGTNGKSTTTTWIATALARRHQHVVRATTLGYFLDDERLECGDDFEGFAAALSEAHTSGARVAALEVTSESLQAGFCKLWPFRVGVFTNLTRDHLDVHTSAEHYLASKAQLFIHLQKGGAAVLNACDPASALLREVVPDGVEILTYGVTSRGSPSGSVDLLATSAMFDGERTRVRLERSARVREFPDELTLQTIGDIYVEDALAAALGAWAAGVPAGEVVDTLASVRAPTGRFELVAQAPTVVVDYAHTPDALARTIAAARTVCRGRLVLVFGAGGDRDRAKRGPMGRAAARADVVYVTNDNPRTEDPRAIARDLRDGLGAHPAVTVELDRARAIGMAIQAARDEDMVLVCGKGHETEQLLDGARQCFSDQDVARAAVARLPDLLLAWMSDVEPQG